jgi:hypothetical protein
MNMKVLSLSTFDLPGGAARTAMSPGTVTLLISQVGLLGC